MIKNLFNFKTFKWDVFNDEQLIGSYDYLQQAWAATEGETI